MKRKKIMSVIAAVFMSATMALGTVVFTGCGEKTDPSAIQISVSKLGYGTEWLHNIARAYTEKTGNTVQITEEIGQEGNSKIIQQIESLSGKADIAFVEKDVAKYVYDGSVSAGGVNYDCLFADLSDVYNAELPGEFGKTIESKMRKETRDYLNFDGKYYSLPWAGGITGIVINNTKWKELGFKDAEIPLTTEQLFEVCDKIADKKASPFIYSAGDEYYSMFSPVWFAQYEGRANMDGFLAGRDPEGNVSEYIYSYDGQRATLNVMEKLLAAKYQDSASESLDFSDMQGYFLNGRSVFCVNGAWLEIEMRNSATADIRFMKTPVVSEIVNKTPSLTEAARNAGVSSDEILVKVIKEIDEGKTSSEIAGITQVDFNIVKEARGIAYITTGTSAQAVIPAYAANIEKAKDFLKFFYSDEGLNIYYTTLKGATIPVTPTNGYAGEIQLSDFRKSVNQAEESGITFNYSSKAKIFVSGGVDKYFRNGTGSIVNNFNNGISVDKILADNSASVKSNWSTIRKYL